MSNTNDFPNSRHYKYVLEKERVKGILNNVIDKRNICENYIKKKRIDKF